MLGPHPEWWLTLLVLFGVLPLSPINRVAALVVAARLATQFAYELGVPEFGSQVLIYGTCAALGIHNARLFTCFVAAALFVPLAAASAWQCVDPYHGWWAVYWLALLQALVLIANGEWKRAIRHWLTSSDPDEPHILARMFARVRHV